MKLAPRRRAAGWLGFGGMFLFSQTAAAHVTLRSAEPLRPGMFSARVTMVVPNERHVATTRVVLEVPEGFRQAGGRLSRVEMPSDWEVRIEREDKPEEIYRRDAEARARRDAERGAASAQSEEEKQEEAIRSELLKQWITRVSFEGGSIPPDGFKEFSLGLQLPGEPGRYYFPVTQIFADGKEVSWSETVEGEGVDNQAASIVVERPFGLRHLGLLVAALALVALWVRPVRRYQRWKHTGANAPGPVAQS